MKILHIVFIVFLLSFTISKASGRIKNPLTISNRLFLKYTHFIHKKNHYDSCDTLQISEFKPYRTYLNVNYKFTKSFSARTTSNHKADNGSYKLLIKYAYAKFRLKDLAFFTKNILKFSVVPRTWISFKKQLNKYRILNTMFIERLNLINSANIGLYFKGTLGKDNTTVLGKYDNYSIGVYNSGGYANVNINNNKVIERRISFRPFWYIKSLYNILLSYGAAYDNPNHKNIKNFSYHFFMLSYQNKYLTNTLTYIYNKGDYLGTNNYYTSKSIEKQAIAESLELKLNKFTTFGQLEFFNSQRNILDYAGECS